MNQLIRANHLSWKFKYRNVDSEDLSLHSGSAVEYNGKIVFINSRNPVWIKESIGTLFAVIVVLNDVVEDRSAILDFTKFYSRILYIHPGMAQIEIERIIDDGKTWLHQCFSSHDRLKQIAHSNRQLENLTRSQEAQIEERTFMLKVSEFDERERLAKIKSLIKFIKSLGVLNTIADVLVLLKIEIKKFHSISDLFFVFEEDLRNDIVAFQGSVVSTKKILRKDFDLRAERVIDRDRSQAWANILGRPVGKLLSICIDDDSNFKIVIEHRLDHGEYNDFMDFIKDRSLPIKTIVEQIRSIERIQFSSMRWESTFDAVRDPIAILSKDNIVVRSNKQFSKEADGQICFKAWGEKKDPCDACSFFDRSVVHKVDKTDLIRKEGRFYSLRSYPIEFSETYFINHYVDQTREKELFGKMVQTEKMEAVGVLAGSLAHEINNPLAGIQSLVQLLKNEHTLSSTFLNDMEEIEKAAKRSQGIVRDLVLFSSGKSELEWVKLDELVHRTVPLFKSILIGHRLEMHLGTGESQINVRPQLIQQVIFNVVHNSCQAMVTAGTIQIVTMVQQQNSAQGLLLQITDTGLGVSKELGTRVFEAFYTTKIESGGTGLGLSMARTIVESFGGKIGFNLEYKGGAQLNIWFPAKI